MSLLKSFKFLSEKDLDATSESQKDGIAKETEQRLRSLGAALIQTVGSSKLGLPQSVIATASVYYHMFYAKQSFKRHDRLAVAIACVFLAAKAEEAPKPIKAVIHAMYSYRFRKNPVLRRRIMEDEDTFAIVKDRILVVERSLLYTLGFDFNIKHPYKCMVNLRKYIFEDFFGNEELSSPKWDAIKNEIDSTKVMQASWNFANDSLRLTLCLQYDASCIGVACFFLGIKMLRLNADNGGGAGEDGKASSPLAIKGWWSELLTESLNHVHPKWMRSMPPGVQDKEAWLEKERQKVINEDRREYRVENKVMVEIVEKIMAMYKIEKKGAGDGDGAEANGGDAKRQKTNPAAADENNSKSQAEAPAASAAPAPAVTPTS